MMVPPIRSSRQDAAFPAHDGTILRGWFYPAAGTASDADAPGVVMSHGFSATREMGLEPHAEAFAAAGLAVLLYDHRALGTSDGDPRGLIDPFVQTRDMMAAVGWLGGRPGVDGARLALWGTSYSGGEALILAALDPRVRAAVTIVPAVGQVAALPSDAGPGWAALAARVRNAQIDPDAVIGPRAVVPAPDALPTVLMPDPDTAAWMRAQGALTQGRWRNAVLSPAPRRHDIAFDPAPALRFLQAPVLIVAGAADRVTPAADARIAADLAGDMAEYLLLDGHHCSFYAGEAGAPAAVAAAIGFYGRRL